MRFEPQPCPGVYLIELEPAEDDRGAFARTYCRESFASHGLEPCEIQCNISRNTRRATLRGMHWQAEPGGEAKLIRVGRGAIHDVVVDIRPSSPTYLRAVGVELNERNNLQLYVPPGFAHGFVTLADDTEVVYQMSRAYAPDLARGARWNDPAFAIDWPIEPTIISERDRSHPDFAP